MRLTHSVSETYRMGNARHRTADTLSFILGTLGNMKTGELTLWFTKIVPTLENSKAPRIRKVLYRKLPSPGATFDRQVILKR